MNETALSDWLAGCLRERRSQANRREEIDAEIFARLGRRCAVMVLDMSGFSRLTTRHGVLHFLAMIRAMTDLAGPLVTTFRGRCIKQEADNLFAIFESVDDAAASARAILRAMAQANVDCHDDECLYASFGIGYGDILLIGDHDFFGNEVNLACKLGEDLAQRGEVLLTEAAFAALGERGSTPQSFSISGIDLPAYRLQG